MRRKLHPLEVYQRGRPFGGAGGPVREEAPSPRRSGRKRASRAGVGDRLRRLAGMPLLGATVAAATLLVLASAGLYAAGFWPFSRGANAPDDARALRREWPDRTTRGAGAEDRVFCIQVAAGVATEQDVSRWLEEEALWDARVREEFPGHDYFAKALLVRGTGDGRNGDQVVVVLGQWTSSEESDVEAVLRWARGLQPEAALKGIRPQDLSSN